MKKKIAVIAVLLVIGAGFLIPGCARKKPHGFEDRLGGMIDKISNSLNLNETQKKKAVEIKEKILNKNRELRESESKNDREIEEAFAIQIKSDKFDDKALNKLLDAKISKMDEMRRLMIAELKSFHEVLTPEQRIKLSGILKEIAPKHGPRPGPEKKQEAGK